MQNFGTYLGNDLEDTVRDLVLDAGGNAYVVGGARSANLLPGAPVAAFGGEEDAFVAKLGPTGAVLWWTFLGGAGPDRAYAVDLDGQGNVVVGGAAAAAFPVTAGVVLPTFQGGTSSASDPARDGFLAKFSGANGAVVWATYFGGSDGQANVVRDVAADPLTNEIYFTASATSPPAPTHPSDYLPQTFPQVILDALQNGHQPLRPGDQVPNAADGILGKITADGTQLPWVTYVGGSGAESFEGNVRLDSQGRPVALFVTNSATRVVTPAVLPDTRPDPDIVGVPAVAGPLVLAAPNSSVYDPQVGSADFFVAKYEADGTAVFATYIGGSGDETIDSNNLALRADGRIVVAGNTHSSTFPVSPGAYDPTLNGIGGTLPYSGDCGVFVLEADGSARVAATFYGGGNGEGCSAVAVDGSNNVYVAGGTRSHDLPTASGAFQTKRPASLSIFAAVFSADLALLRFGTYFGGDGGANANALVLRAPSQFTFGGQAGRGYPLPTAPPPARASVSDSAQHGAVSDVTVQLGPG